MKEINFVRGRIKALTKLGQNDKKFFNIAAITTSVFLLILAGVLGFKFYFVSQLGDIQSSRENLLERIKSKEATEKSFVLFVSKLRVLSEIFSQRKDKQDVIGYFSQVFGPDVVIDRIAYDADSQLLAFGLLSKDIFTLETVFDILDSEQSKQRFSSLAKSNLQRNSGGTYRMQITIVLGKEGEK
ncbi:hypothetical protein KKE34_04965 [Patescibacteria group bacterium]|nr:hypothetical protein [Patescibacteria group bacterium]MBU1885925.1 hypothetical protein [Patescibacteria group bacterium]